MKKCSTCKNLKPKDCFYKRKRNKDGLTYQCKDCVRSYQRSEQGQESYAHYVFSGKRADVARKYRKSRTGKAAHAKWLNSPSGSKWYKKYQSKYQKEYNQTKRGKKMIKHKDKRYAEKHPDKISARAAVNNAVASGQLSKAGFLECAICNNQASQYHHHSGYDKHHHLDVIPVCKSCHVNIHHQ